MKILAGLLVLAACMPYMVQGDDAAAAAAAASGDDAAAAAAAASGYDAAAAAAAASGGYDHGRFYCTQQYDPVCANNDVTFANDCFYRWENRIRQENHLPLLWKRWAGRCDCGCSNVNRPVCARIGNIFQTFRNLCALRCLNRKLKQDGRDTWDYQHEGRCRGCNCLQKCGTSNPFPVCGSDDVTYYNDCWLNCNRPCAPLGLKKRHNGPC